MLCSFIMLLHACTLHACLCKSVQLAVMFAWLSIAQYIINCKFIAIFITYLIFCYDSIVLVGLGFLIVEVSRSHSDTPQYVGLFWTSDQPIAETTTWQHTTAWRDRHPMNPSGFELAIPESRRRQINASDRVAIGIGYYISYTYFRKVNTFTLPHTHAHTHTHKHTHSSVLDGNYVNECVLPARVARFPR